MAEKFLEVNNGQIQTTENFKSQLEIIWKNSLTPENLKTLQEITENLNNMSKTEWYSSRVLSKLPFVDSKAEKIADKYSWSVENALKWFESWVISSVDEMLAQLLKETQKPMDWKNVYEVAYNASNRQQLNEIMKQL